MENFKNLNNFNNFNSGKKFTGQSRVKAAIDIGSNSIKLRVARRTGGRTDVLLDTTEVVHLGRGLVDGRIPGRTLDNAARVVTEMVRCAREMGAEPRLVGTMALRTARNAEDFLSRIRGSTGLDVKIISGDEEARYSWKGASSGLDLQGLQDGGHGDLVMFDTGGGSTEFVFSRDGTVFRIQSVPVGAVPLTEKFFNEEPVRQASLDAASQYIKDLLNENGIARGDPDTLPSVVGLGGGVVAMASVKSGSDSFIPTDLHGMTLNRRDLVKQIRLYSLLTLEERRSVIGLPPSRADVVLGSACIVLCILRALDAASCLVSINGLRHGILIEMFEEDEEKNKN